MTHGTIYSQVYLDLWDLEFWVQVRMKSKVYEILDEAL